jgi:hypothetical protein
MELAIGFLLGADDLVGNALPVIYDRWPVSGKSAFIYASKRCCSIGDESRTATAQGQ